MKITQKGQVTIPKAVRERNGLYPGTDVRFVERNHQVVVEKAKGADALEKYYGYVKKHGTLPKWAQRTDVLIRLMRGERP